LIYLKRFGAGVASTSKFLAQMNKSLLALSKKYTLDEGTP